MFEVCWIFPRGVIGVVSGPFGSKCGKYESGSSLAVHVYVGLIEDAELEVVDCFHGFSAAARAHQGAVGAPVSRDFFATCDAANCAALGAVQTDAGLESVRRLAARLKLPGIPRGAKQGFAAFGAAVAFLVRVKDVRSEKRGRFFVNVEGETRFAAWTVGLGKIAPAGFLALGDDQGDFGSGERAEFGAGETRFALAHGALHGYGGVCGRCLRFLNFGRTPRRGWARRGRAGRADAAPRWNKHGERARRSEQNSDGENPVRHRSRLLGIGLRGGFIADNAPKTACLSTGRRAPILRPPC